MEPQIENATLPKLRDLFSIKDNVGTCNKCGHVIQMANGGTTLLHRHTETGHKQRAYKRLSKPKTKTLTVEITKLDALSSQFPLEAMLSRMTACDGLSFHVFETSTDLRRGIEALISQQKMKDTLITTSQSIKSDVMRFGERVRILMQNMFKTRISKGEYFSVCFDEWSSLANCRYMNVTIFYQEDHFWSLGLVKISGKADAENLLSLVNKRLESFGLDTQKHIAGFITDGAKVMEKLHSISVVEHQLCIVHGIQLAVTDVLYSKKAIVTGETVCETNDNDVSNDAEEESSLRSGLELEVIEEVSQFSSVGIHNLISKVRKIGAHFKRSPLDNEKLQMRVQSQLQVKDDMPLKIDSRTQWSSLYDMLERFYELADCVEHVAKQIKGLDIRISMDEKVLILCLLKILKPVKLTVKALCSRKCDLIKARAALHVLFRQLQRQNNPISRQFVSRLKLRIRQRWTINAGVLHYLQTGTYVDVNCTLNLAPDSSGDDDDNDVDSSKFYTPVFDNFFCDPESESITISDIFDLPTKQVIKEHLIRLIMRLCPEAPKDNELPVMTEPVSENDPPPAKRKRSFEEKLNSAVYGSENLKIQHVSEQSAISKILTQEMNFLEKNKTRGRYLSMVYNILKTIKPTSVESERAFSSAGSICTKIRTRLNDNTLDTLAFLRSQFKNPESSPL